MAYKSKEEVRKRALLYCEALQRTGFDANILPNSFRDYKVKVSVKQASSSYGNLIVHHNPTKGIFKLSLHELKDKSAVPILEKIWGELDGLKPADPGLTESEITFAVDTESLAERTPVVAVDGSPQAVNSAETDPLVLLERKAPKFVAYLRQHGIDSTYQGIKNNQYARFSIGSRKGYLDVYCTDKRLPSNPHLHGFNDESFEKQIKTYWQHFWDDSSPLAVKSNTSLLPIATHYYRLLEPYRNCQFDFIHLAIALDRAKGDVGVSLAEQRYNFAALEKVYLNLQRREGLE